MRLPRLRIPAHEDIRDIAAVERARCPASETLLTLVSLELVQRAWTTLDQEQVDTALAREILGQIL